MGKQKTGENGNDVIIEVPPGSLIADAETDELLKDMTIPGEIFIAATGGRGGKGNRKFRTSTNRAPRFAQPGEPGKTLNINMELKLLADVGIIGLPNAGKSTLISAMSSARVKTGAYPFTTLSPNLGVVQTEWGEPFVAADMPGLIKDAHRGAGLGIKFLRHIERTRILLHLLDASSIDHETPVGSYNSVAHEISKHNSDLAARKQVVVLNKIDIPGALENANIFESVFKKTVLRISALSGDGVKKLISELAKLLNSADGTY